MVLRSVEALISGLIARAMERWIREGTGAYPRAKSASARVPRLFVVRKVWRRRSYYLPLVIKDEPEYRERNGNKRVRERGKYVMFNGIRKV